MKATHPTDRATRLEGVVLVLILLVVASFAGAASFTHVKDWTLANSPTGTGEWFGWANAVISELVPIAALLTIRRRRRSGGPIGYPMFLLIAAATLSLSAQLAVAKPSPSGWLLSAVPALAFMALAKLVLAPVNTSSENNDTSAPNETTEATTNSGAAPVVEATPAADHGSAPAPTAVPPTTTSESAELVDPVTVPAHLIPAARFAIVNHQQHTGRPITPDELATRLDTTPAIAARLLADINPPAPPAHINGAHLGAGA